MREIKFRAWDKDKKEMFEVKVLSLWSPYKTPAKYEDGSGTPWRSEIMQFTGLYDRNGKEIYEGDIVKYVTVFYGKEGERRKVVKWDEWVSDDFGQPDCSGYFNVSDVMEVIGNIYEDPELLAKSSSKENEMDAR